MQFRLIPLLRPLRAGALTACGAAVVTTAAALLTACGEDHAAVSEPQAVEADSQASHKTTWLEVESGLSPEQWLASHKEETLRTGSDPIVRRVGSLLDEAHRLYRESQRMIANRTVQIEGMLQAQGQPDDAIGILEDLSQVPGEVGQTEGFGAIGQHYVNLRGGGLDRVAALAELKRLYGKRPEK